MPTKGAFASHRVVDGIERKFCRPCNSWLTLDHFHAKSRERGYYHPCRRCRSHGPNPLMPFKPQVHGWLKALVNRVGKAEASRLCGFAKSQVSRYMGAKPPQKVERATAKAILEAYLAALRADIVISRNSIKHGNFERGKTVKMANLYTEYYDPVGDEGTTYKRRRRAIHRETE